MTAWSPSEASRTLDEAKRRSLIDPAFRELALSDPASALAKINPRHVPVGSVRFIESKDAGMAAATPQLILVVLPDLNTSDEDLEELNENELEQVAGGTNPPTPPTDPPIGNS
jgi:bacteriocin-like protein